MFPFRLGLLSFIDISACSVFYRSLLSLYFILVLVKIKIFLVVNFLQNND